MRTIAADRNTTGIGELIDAARQEPVTVVEAGQIAAIVLSPTEFARLSEPDRIRRQAKTRLRETMAKMHEDAKERGLTEAELERLLADGG